jgi:hypothetical protein
MKGLLAVSPSSPSKNVELPLLILAYMIVGVYVDS